VIAESTRTDPPRTRSATAARIVASVPWLLAIILIAVSVVRGIRLQDQSPEVFLGAAPLVGRNPTDGWDWRFSWALVAATGVGLGVVVATARGWWWRWRTRTIVLVVAVGAAAFAVLLALTDGSDGLLRGAVHPTEYLANLPEIGPIGSFVRGFVDDIDRYSVHVRGHPPGFMVLLAAMDAIGLGGQWPVVALSVIGTALAPAGVLVAVWAVGGVDWVRRAAPLLVVAPYALWMMTSADALYAAVGAWAVAACVLGLRSSGVRSAAWGSLCGLLLGCLLFFTYGGAMFVIVPIVPTLIALRRRRPGVWPMIGGAVVAAGLVTAAWAAAGFWWFAGAAETRLQYWAGTAQFRPLGYFLLANLAATLIAIGPASFGGLLRLWGQRRTPPPITPLILGGLIALLAAHASQYSRAEVERIWMIFFPWLVLAGSLLVDRPDAARPGRAAPAMVVGVQVVLAVLLQASLVSKW
jgi:methylthioxylose transferase